MIKPGTLIIGKDNYSSCKGIIMKHEQFQVSSVYKIFFIYHSNHSNIKEYAYQSERIIEKYYNIHEPPSK
tara:strand:+ start:362 stop:571 length:210 start_codon:yes stop_codon:yes gene_type:complete